MKACVLTISTSVAARERADEDGPLVAELLDKAGHDVSAMEVIPDDYALIEDRIHHYSDDDYALIITTGGTGPAFDDVTPEATSAAVDRPAPGIAEAIRAARGPGTAEAMLCRGVAGFCRRTLVVNLPGHPDSIRQSMAVLEPVLGQALQTLRGE